MSLRKNLNCSPVFLAAHRADGRRVANPRHRLTRRSSKSREPQKQIARNAGVLSHLISYNSPVPAPQGGSCRYRTPRRASPAFLVSAAGALGGAPSTGGGSEAAAFLPQQETRRERTLELADVPKPRRPKLEASWLRSAHFAGTKLECPLESIATSVSHFLCLIFQERNWNVL
jgi:hypothetical protein